MDFCFAIGSVRDDSERLKAAVEPLLLAELAASKRLEAAVFGKAGPDLFRREVVLDYLEPPQGQVASRTRQADSTPG